MTNCPRCGTAYLSETSHVCRGIFAAFHQGKPMRDTATLVELLEAEQGEWIAEMVKHRLVVHSDQWSRAVETLASIKHLLRVYREEASRGTA